MPLAVDLPALWLPPKPAIIRPARTICRPPFRLRFDRAVLPGIAPIIGGAGGAASVEYRAQATSTATDGTITIPAGATVGDLAVLFDWAVGASSTVVPTGWTQIDSTLTATSVRSTVSYKVLQSGDPGSTITGQDGASSNNKVMIVFNPNGTISAVTPSTWNGQATANNPTAQTVAASGGAAPLIVFGNANSTTTTGFTTGTVSPLWQDTLASSGSSLCVVGYTIYNANPIDQDLDMGDQGTNCLRSGYLELGVG